MVFENSLKLDLKEPLGRVRWKSKVMVELYIVYFRYDDGIWATRYLFGSMIKSGFVSDLFWDPLFEECLS